MSYFKTNTVSPQPQVNQNGVSEVRFEFNGTGRHLSLVLSVEERSSRMSAMECVLDANAGCVAAAALHKRLVFQAKLVVANYSNVTTKSLS